MTKNSVLFWILSLIVAGTAALAQQARPAGGSDWPQWGGTDPGRNMVSSETNLPDTFDPGKSGGTGGIVPDSAKNVRWRASIGTHIYGNPTVAGGKVFVGTDGSGTAPGRFKTKPAGRVLCLDEATGKLIWELSIPKSSKARLKDNFLSQEMSGVCSSPAVDGNRVYVLTGGGVLLCLTVNGLAAGNVGPFHDEGRFMVPEDEDRSGTLPTDADIVWTYDLIKELSIHIHDVSSCSPLVHGPYIYLVTSNGVGRDHKSHPRPDAPSLIVIDKKTGRLVAADGEKVGQRLFHCLWSPPSLGVVNGRPLVFFGGGDGVCYAFETPSESASASVPTTRPGEGAGPAQILKKVWSYDCVPPEYKTRDGKPIDYRDGDKRKGTKGPNANDGTYVGPSEIIATPVFYRNRVYVAIGQDPAHGRGRGMLHCIDATKTGDITKSGRVWTFDKIERTLSSVAIADGRLYVADIAGHVFCLDPDTGNCLWTFDLQAETWSTPLVADGKVYVGSMKGLHILAAGPEAKELGRIKLDSASYGTVVAANGTLFVASSRNLWAVQKAAAATQPAIHNR